MIHRLDFERLSLHFVVITTTKVTVKFVFSLFLYVIVVSKANDYVFHLGPDSIYSVKNKADGGDTPGWSCRNLDKLVIYEYGRERDMC